jgi:hypothetical protein
MATIRGRMVKVGGVAVQPQGAAGRTAANQTNTGASTLLRPAFTFNAGIFKPTMPSSFTGLFDPHTVLFWRMVLVVAAVGYIWGWHLKLPIAGRVRL